MKLTVVIFQTSDKQWHLQSYDVNTCQVYMLLTFNRLIEALDVASSMQLRVDNELPLKQYYEAAETFNAAPEKVA